MVQLTLLHGYQHEDNKNDTSVVIKNVIHLRVKTNMASLILMKNLCIRYYLQTQHLR